MTTCPDCNGTGIRATALQNTSGRDIPCDRCKQTGTIPDHMTGWIAKGTALRTERLAADRSTREEARRRNLLHMVYAQAEQGMIDPDTLPQRSLLRRDREGNTILESYTMPQDPTLSLPI